MLPQIANLTDAEVPCLTECKYECHLIPTQLDAVTEKMLTPGTGLDIKDRSYHLRTYRDCFVGADSVSVHHHQKKQQFPKLKHTHSHI